MLAVVVAVVAVIVLGGGSGPPARRGHHGATGGQTTGHLPQRPFSPNSVWNAALPRGVPLSPASQQYVTTLEQQVRSSGPWINTTQYSVPVYIVGPNQPRVPVKLDQSAPGSVDELARAFAAGVPIPRGAQASRGTDQHLVIWQPSSDTMWEFWRAHQVDGAWHAYWGGKMTDVSHNPGYFTNPPDWGASATSLPLLGGLMMPGEIRAGEIDHALAMAVPTASTRAVWPAQRSDGHDSSPTAIPEGTRFRLNPDLNIAALHLPPLTAMMARAAQRYGIIVRDQSGAVTFYAQTPPVAGPNPYAGPHGLFDGLGPDQLLRDFPWSQLQVVSPGWKPQG